MTRQHATNLEFFHIHSSIDNAALERSRVVYTKRKKENDWSDDPNPNRTVWAVTRYDVYRSLHID